MKIRVTTWNLQGREAPDLDEVAAVISGLSPDVVVLQEVQRDQAADVAEQLGWHHRWWFKHWTVIYPAEGLAVLSSAPIGDAYRIGLAHWWRFWSWRRRVAAAVTVAGVRVVDVHLGAGVSDLERARQAAVVVRAVGDRPLAVVAGDLNARPGSVVVHAFAAAGFDDAWTAARPHDGSTNWGRSPRSEPPVQRIDYVLARGFDIADAIVGDGPDPDWPRLGALSDHAPLTATLLSKES